MTKTTGVFATFLLLLVICNAKQAQESAAEPKKHDLEQVISEIEVSDPEWETKCPDGDHGHNICHTKGKNWSEFVRSMLRAMSKVAAYILQEKHNHDDDDE
ncbi:hypothetical protein T265_03442 [Opisthorchis viverrini]|uniref:Uncharacterized protein n=1 Tax=Opisthorchis viverrini TaxID=6198 RepID=A0A074ZW10_OPIVI|nr:hypothetical protein T265_03442 [Opisthorchis viverrini]KER30072.1 hypothetical protein T265_03442 [Opisthorchis viverrini]